MIRVSAIACLLLSVHAAAVAQNPDEGDGRRWLVLQTGGPVGTVRALRFSPKSNALFAAGIEKCVHGWSLRTKEDGHTECQHAQYLRWEIGRAERGALYAMDVAPDGRVAVAGGSARDAAGDIAIFDSMSNRMVALLPDPRAAGPSAAGHRNTVVSLSFSADGKHLVSSDKDGEVRVWTFLDSGTTCRTPRAPDPRLHGSQQAVVFLGNRYVVFTHDASRIAGRQAPGDALHVYDVQKETIVRTHRTASLVTAIARDRHAPERWAAAEAAGRVSFFQGTEAGPVRIVSAPGVVRGLDLGPNHRVLLTADDGKGMARLVLWQLEPQKVVLLDSISLGSAQPAYCCALSDDGRCAAAYAPDVGGVRLFDLATHQGPRRRPLDAVDSIRLSGHGRTFRRVTCADRGYQVALLAEDGTTFGFDLAAPALKRLGGIPKSLPVDPRPWTCREDARRQSLRVARNDHPGLSGVVDLGKTDERVSAYCWVHNGRGVPVALAVAWAPQNGIYIYGLAHHGACPVLRYFRDHSDRVVSLSVTADGKYLVSTGLDQQVKVWSLDGILEQNAVFRPAPAWGAVFQIRNGQVVVTHVRDGGTVQRRGMRAGDVLARIVYREGAKRVETADPRDILRRLETQRLWENLAFQLKRDPQERWTTLVPGWEPLLTLFVAEDDQWALWNPAGFYEATTIGDEFFGWQVNQGWGIGPVYHPAAAFRHELERPDLIRELLLRGTLRKAAARAKVDLPEAVAWRTIEATPTVEIVKPKNHDVFAAGKPIHIVANVRVPPERRAEEFELKAFANQAGGESKTFALAPGATTATVEWRIIPPDRWSRICVDVVEKRTGTVRYEANVTVNVCKTRWPEFRVHVLAIGAWDYKQLEKLRSVEPDLKSFETALREQARFGKRYRLADADVHRLNNDDITPDNLHRLYEELEMRLGEGAEDGEFGQEDLLLFYLAGHGDTRDDQYHFLLPSDSKSSTPSALGWSVFQKFSELPCRKFFLIDTCGAGKIKDELDKTYKPAVRGLLANKVMVLCACKDEQSAWSNWSDNHSMFAHYLLEAVRGEAAGPSCEWVSLEDVKTHVVMNVTKKTYEVQVPVFYREGDMVDFMKYGLFRAGVSRNQPAPGATSEKGG